MRLEFLLGCSFTSLLCLTTSARSPYLNLAKNPVVESRIECLNLQLFNTAPSTREVPDVDDIRIPTIRARASWHWVMSNDWLVDFHDFTCLLPTATAAATMESFYEDVAAYAALTTSIMSNRVEIWLGGIMLEVVGPAGSNLSRRHIQAFAMDMLAMTKRGYTNTYLINYVHRPTGKLLTFSLYVGLVR